MKQSLLSLLLGLSLASAASLEIAPARLGVAVGEVATVKVYLKNHPVPHDIAGVSFVLSYNAQILQVVDAEQAPTKTLATQEPFPLSLLNEVDNETGVIRLAVGATTPQSTPIEVITIHFIAKQQGTATLEWVEGSSIGLFFSPFPWEEKLAGKGALVIAGEGGAGTGLPSSSVLPLDRYTSSVSFPVSWYGQDDGTIVGFHLQYSVNDGLWQDWKKGSDLLFTTTSATFGPDQPVAVQNGTKYSFRSRALDKDGFWEPFPAEPDAETIVDTEPPEIVILFPEADSIVGGKKLVQIEASDNTSAIAYVQLFVDGQQVKFMKTPPFQSALEWSAFKEGTHSLVAVANDLAGNRAEATVSVFVDNTPPEVKVDPLPDVYGGQDILLTFHGEDNTKIESYDVLAKEGDQDWQFVAEGLTKERFLFHGEAGKEYAFKVRARDIAGNFSHLTDQDIVRTRTDASFPQITIQSPPLFVSESLWLKADVVDDGGVRAVRFFLDGKQVASFAEPPFELQLPTAELTEGLHSFEVEATDNQGKAAQLKHTFTLDKTPPQMVPLQLPSSANAPFEVSWKAQDAYGTKRYDIEYRVNQGSWLPWLEGTQKTTAVFGENNFPIKLEGEMAIELRVRAYDFAGNASAYTHASILFSPDAPYVEWEGTKNALFVRDRLHKELRTSTNIAHIKLLVDDQVVATLNQSPYSVEMDVSNFKGYEAEGCLKKDTSNRCVHELVAEAVSVKGIKGRSSPLLFYVDRMPPTVTLDVPEVSQSVFFHVALSASDGQGSGINTLELQKKEGDQWKTVLNTSAENLTLFAPHGSKVLLRLRAKDFAGNVSPYVERTVLINAFEMRVSATEEDHLLVQIKPRQNTTEPPSVFVLQNGAPVREAELLSSSVPFTYEARLLPNYDGPGRIYIGSGEAVFPFSSATLSKSWLLASPDGQVVANLPSGGSVQEVVYLLQNEGIFVTEKAKSREQVFRQISPVYEFGPKRKSFNAPLELTFRYRPLAVLDPVKLAFYKKEGNEWIFLPSKVNLFEHSVHVRGKEAGEYAVFLDSLPPQVTVTEPKEGEVLQNFTGSFQAKLQDEGSGVDMSTVSVRVDGFRRTFKIEGNTISGDLGKLSSGNHTLEIQAKDRLGNTVLAKHSFSVKERDLDILEAYSFPNPTSQEATFRVVLTKTRGVTVEVELYSQTGQKLSTALFSPQEVKKGRKKVSFSSLANGVYFWRIKATDGSKVVNKIHKLVVLR